MLDALLGLWVGRERSLLDDHVRAGLVLASPFLRPALRATLAPELARLHALASEDDDAWVRLLAAAVGAPDKPGPGGAGAAAAPAAPGAGPACLSLDAIAAQLPAARVFAAAAAAAAGRLR